MYRSEYTQNILRSLTPAAVTRLLRQHTCLSVVIGRFLADRVGTWTNTMTACAHSVLQAPMCTLPVEIRTIIGDELNRMTTACDTVRDELLTPETLPVVTTVAVPNPHVDETDAVATAPPAEPRTESTTLRPVAATLRQELFPEYECELIGSGVFHTWSDLDVVVTVPTAGSLSEAYRTLLARLDGEWTPQYVDEPSEDRVSIVRGHFRACGRPPDLAGKPRRVRRRPPCATYVYARSRRPHRVSRNTSHSCTGSPWTRGARVTPCAVCQGWPSPASPSSSEGSRAT